MDRSNPRLPVARCERCGREEAETAAATAEAGQTYQVVVACATCGVPFASLSRN